MRTRATSLSFAAVFVGALSTAAVPARDLIQIYQVPELGGSQQATSVKTATLTAAEDKLIASEILPAARRYWSGRSVICDSSGPDEFIIVGTVAQGSFSKPRTSQKAILYRYCVTGHNFADNGIVVFDSDRVAAHVVYAGGWDDGIWALPDFVGNGQSKILISTGGTAQEESWQVISVIGLTEKGVRPFGHAETYDGDCEAGNSGFRPPNYKPQETTYKLFVKRGPVPVFYRETFRGDCGTPPKWHKSGALEQIVLQDIPRPSGTTWSANVKYVRLQ